MKIRIIQTIEIDPAAWATEFGVARRDVRDDVQSYFAGWCQQQVAQLGLAPQADDRIVLRGRAGFIEQMIGESKNGKAE